MASRSFLMAGSSLALENNFNTCPAIAFKIAGTSMSLAPATAGQAISMSLECNFDRFPSTAFRLSGCSLSIVTLNRPDTVLSFSLLALPQFVQVIDLKKGTSMLMKKNN